MTLLPRGRQARVRGMEVHDEPVGAPSAGQRARSTSRASAAREIPRGDVLADGRGSSRRRASTRCRAGREERPRRRARQRPSRTRRRRPAGRARRRGSPAAARAAAARRCTATALVIRRRAAGHARRRRRARPGARRHGSSRGRARPPRTARRGETRRRRRPPPAPEPGASPEPPPLTERRWPPRSGCARRAHGHRSTPSCDAQDLARAACPGRAVGSARRCASHPEALAAVEARIVAVIERDGAITLAAPARRAGHLAQVRAGLPRAPRRRARHAAPGRRARPAPALALTASIAVPAPPRGRARTGAAPRLDRHAERLELERERVGALGGHDLRLGAAARW